MKYLVKVKPGDRLSAANHRAFYRGLKKCLMKHDNYATAIGEAVMLSELNAVKSVDIVHVKETKMGTWIKGRKSKMNDKEKEPLFYVSDNTIFQRLVRSEKGVAIGFAVCEVCDDVDPDKICKILNKGKRP